MARKAKTACIYQILRSETGDSYVGSTSSKADRWGAHRRDLRKGRHHAPHLQAAWTKYGESAFEFVVLEVCESEDLKETLKAREDHWMATVKPVYNVLQAAYSALGFKMPADGVERRAAKLRGVPRPRDVVERSAASRRGMKMPREAVERMARSNIGRVKSQETRDKLSRAMTGKPKSQEQIENMRKARIGFKHTEATKEKNRIASTGRKNPNKPPHTQETKDRIAAGVAAAAVRRREARLQTGATHA